MAMQSPPPTNQQQGFIAVSVLVISLAANVVTVWGFLENKNVGLIMAAMLTVLGATIIAREWNKPFTSKVLAAWVSVVLGAVIGGIVLLLPLVRQAAQFITPPTATVTVTPTIPLPPSTTYSSPPPVPTAPTTTAQNNDAAIFDGEALLGTKMGVDLESGPRSGRLQGIYTNGPVGPIDLYIDWVNMFKASGGGLYSYTGSEADARERCSALVHSTQAPQPALPIETLQFCFTTSDNHVGWTRVDAANPAVNQDIVLRVKVWP